MIDRNRRSFLTSSAAAAAAFSVAPALQAANAGKKVVIGQIGCGNQGKSHTRSLTSLQDAELAYICDPDAERLGPLAEKAGGAEAVTDFRRILDDKAVDAVTIAAPDHWHSTAALLALDAGKHVYVEKPCSHNLREGRLLLDAARRHNLVVQHGTQARSCRGFQTAIQMLREGIIGDVLSARAWNIQRRKSIGHAQPSEPPSHLDYDLWLGPAETMPYQSNRLHYNWHWWYNFGCGGIGNDGIHHVDYARWGLGVETLPTRISAVGGKYFFDDDQQFPDTQQVLFEYTGDGQAGSRRMLVYEQRLWAVTYPFNVDAGVEFYGTQGEMFLTTRGKFRVLGPRNRPIERKPDGELKPSVAEHQQNWIDCIQGGGRPNADIEIGHNTAALVHLGNIASRVGDTLEFDPLKEEITNNQEANALLSRKYREGGHWAIPQSV